MQPATYFDQADCHLHGHVVSFHPPQDGSNEYPLPDISAGTHLSIGPVGHLELLAPYTRDGKPVKTARSAD